MTGISKMTIVRLLAVGMIALPLGACTTDGANRSMESIHQPVVSYSAYTFDVSAGDGSLSRDEALRMNDWFASIGLGYGDQVSIVTNAGYFNSDVRDGIADVVARHGLLLSEDSSAAAGVAPQGTVRLIVRRATATVPGCPDWSHTAESNLEHGTSSNFGCGINSNFAAMVANPEDLVRGQTSDSEMRTATSNRAISTYREKEPTGKGDLKQLTATGGN